MYSIMLCALISASPDALPIDVGGCHGRAAVGFAVLQRPVLLRSLFVSAGCAGTALAAPRTGCHGSVLFSRLASARVRFAERDRLALVRVPMARTGCAGTVQAVPQVPVAPPVKKMPEAKKK